jgi:hypothetical protein
LIRVAPGDDWCGAINGAAPGDQIVFAPGDYNTPCWIRAQGSPGAWITVRAESQDPSARSVFNYSGFSSNVLELRGTSHLILRGFAFGPTQEDVDAIRVRQADQVVIEENLFQDIGGISIAANDPGSTVAGLVIRNNTFRDLRATGIYLGCHQGDCNVDEIVFEGNLIDGVSPADPSAVGYGIEVKLNSYGLLRDNTVYRTKGPGIMVYGSNQADPPSVVEGNYVEGSLTEGGIVVGGGPAIVRNNVLVGNAYGGISAQNYGGRDLQRSVWIVHNSVLNNQHSGVNVAGWAPGADNVLAYNAILPLPGTQALRPAAPAGTVVGNVVCASPEECFEKASAAPYDLWPKSGGPLQNAAASGDEPWRPVDDFMGVLRGASADVGAFERVDFTFPRLVGDGGARPPRVTLGGDTFQDVPTDHWAYRDIQWLWEGGFVAGCSAAPRLYCPERPLNRAEAAVFIERGLRGGGYQPPQPGRSPFEDVALTDWFVDWVAQLWEDGYTAGCWADPPHFCPLQAHTRAEATVFFLRLLNGRDYLPPEPQELYYRDVPLEAWYAKWVAAADRAGLTRACEDPANRADTRFRPQDPITRAEAACMLVRAKLSYAPMPSLEDEKATYRTWGWTWSPDQEPNFPGDPSYYVQDPDIHGDTEGDDLWTYLHMYRRTGEKGYFDRAAAWARYFKEDYRTCVGEGYADFCYDLDAFGADHLWGWGLVDWYLFTGDLQALEEAERLAEVVEALHGPNTTFGCYVVDACLEYGPRGAARHLLLVTRVAEVTREARWIALRDKILDRILTAPEWDEELGMYFVGEWSTDSWLWEGAYASGARIQSSFQVGWLSEALYRAYLATGREEIRERLVSMARFVAAYGLDPQYQYTGSAFGVVNGQVWHDYSSQQPVTFWDPVYTTSLVNTLVLGYKYSGDPQLLGAAKTFFNRGTKGIYGEPTARRAGDNEVSHFIDTEFASAHGYFYLDNNKGELQYTYLIFENGGDPTVELNGGGGGGEGAP